MLGIAWAARRYRSPSHSRSTPAGGDASCLRARRTSSHVHAPRADRVPSHRNPDRTRTEAAYPPRTERRRLRRPRPDYPLPSAAWRGANADRTQTDQQLPPAAELRRPGRPGPSHRLPPAPQRAANPDPTRTGNSVVAFRRSPFALRSAVGCCTASQTGRRRRGIRCVRVSARKALAGLGFLDDPRGGRSALPPLRCIDPAFTECGAAAKSGRLLH
jgi:hypothetical protein